MEMALFFGMGIEIYLRARRARRPREDHTTRARERGHGSQTSNDASGAPMHPGDVVAQFKLAWKNLVEVLAAAGMKPENIARLNFYTTDVDAFMSKEGELVPIWAEAGCKPVSTLLGVARLFEPSIMVEIEATAVA